MICRTFPQLVPPARLSALLGWGLLLAASNAAQGTMLGRRQATCPICKQTFQAVVLASVDTSAGVDRDLFARAAGPQPVFYLITTCPRCYYSGYLDDDFRPDIKFPKGFKERVLRSPKLQPGMTITPKTDQRMIPAQVRYRLAYQCFQWRGMSEESMAWLCLRASWVARDLGSVMPRTDRLQRVMGFIERWLPPDGSNMNQVDRELHLTTGLAAELAEGRFSRYQVPYVRFVLAMMWRRHGENALFESTFPPDRPDPELPEFLREKVKEVHATIAAERHWQRLARDHFLKALDGDEVSPGNRPAANYVVAELYRRLDRTNRAVRYYDLALADPKINPHLAEWARQQRSQALSRPIR